MKNVLVPVYQPVVDMQTQQVTFFEALARRKDGNDGHYRLIELGESYGFIHFVDLGMLAQVVRELESRPCVTVSVNISVMTIESALGEILSLLFAHIDVAPRLVFEITETVQITNFQKLFKFVHAVRLAGAKVAIDDFGDGFASMNVVERIRPEYVKFPASIVNDLMKTRDVEKMCGLCAQIGGLGASVVAEFVDSREKVELLKEAGVAHGQGYFFGKPSFHPNCLLIECQPAKMIDCRHVGISMGGASAWRSAS